MQPTKTEHLQKASESLSKGKYCYHCNSPIPLGNSIRWTREYNGKIEVYEYCCQGCRAVSEFIIESGNSKFYDIRGSQSLAPVLTPEETNKIRRDYLDGNLVKEEYLRPIDSNFFEVHLTITNIHCSACVWLNEKVLKDLEGIRYARMNYATGRIEIHFNPNLTPLSKIFDTIESIGYFPKLYSPWSNQEASQHNKSLLIRMGVAGFFFGNIMLFGTALYAGYFSGIQMEYKRLLHYLSWALATPVYFYSGWPFLQGAWNALRNRRFSMDILLVTGISLAYFYSIYVTLTDRGEVYFDSVCMIYFFILLGKYLEDNARIRARDKLSTLLSNLPEVATVLDTSHPNEPNERILRVSEIQKGMVLLIRKGERVPVDGILLSNEGYLDESFLTGESIPLIKGKSSLILAGSINTGEPIQILTESSAKNSTLSRLKVLIEKAMGEKPKLERITDRISGYFISLVFSIALATFFYWYFWGLVGLETSLVNTIAVLIVACPCALGLAVPTALVMNHIRSSKDGVIIKNPDSVEKMASIQYLFLDKTGTITEGKLKLVGYQMSELQTAALLTYALEKYSHHPIAKSLVLAMESILLNNQESKDFLSLANTVSNHLEKIKEVPGLGMEGYLPVSFLEKGLMEFNFISPKKEKKDIRIQLGNSKFVNASPKAANEEETDGTKIYLSLDGSILGYWILEDSLRESTKPAIEKLKQLVQKVTLLSGDRESVVKKMAMHSGIPNYIAEAKPETKLQIIEEAQKKGITAMVGDGINDSAALAKADIGISMGIASDLSLDKSDVILVYNNLNSLVRAILYARETKRKIFQNISISFLYNSIMIPLAAMGYMAPVICAVFMALSSLTVVGNSLLIRKSS